MIQPQQLHKFGTVLIWLGVLVWAPFFVLRILGDSPSLWAFLPLHLVGVIGGGRMRTSARQQMGIPKVKRKGYKRLAHWLVIASILIWLPYYGMKLAGRPALLNPFLIVHLIGILGGTGLIAIGGAVETLKKRRSGVVYGTRHTAEETN